MIEIFQDIYGNTIELDVKQLYGTSSEGFDLERDSYNDLLIQLKKWGYRKIGVE